jgi:hypothetical protein
MSTDAAWAAAQQHARTLLTRLNPDDAHGTNHLPVSWEPLALMVHVTAVGARVHVHEVDLARLRYRLGELDARDGEQARQQFQHWLRDGLDTMGHRRYAADDPVENAYWRYTVESTEGDADTIGEWTTTWLETSRRLVRDLLDTALVAARQGWPNDTRVRVVGLPTTVRVGRSTVIDYGDRAVVRAPSWAADHDQQALRPGPPTGYLLGYHVPNTAPDYTAIHPVAVPVDHLTLDA